MELDDVVNRFNVFRYMQMTNFQLHKALSSHYIQGTKKEQNIIATP